MALSADDIAAAARILQCAHDTRQPAVPISTMFPEMAIEDAYAIQRLQVSRWQQEEGRIVRGHKVGITSRDAQRQWGVDQPDFGHLTRDMFLRADAPISIDEFIQPKIEPELAFVVAEPSSCSRTGNFLDHPVTEERAKHAISAIHPALEIIDSRFEGNRVALVDMIADNAESGGIVLGDPCDFDINTLADLTCDLYLNGEVVHRGSGSEVLGSPLRSFVWLANRLAEFGVALLPGDVVLSGSLTRAVPLHAGDKVKAVIGEHARLSAEFK